MINDEIFEDISDYLKVFPEDNPNVSVNVRTGYWNEKDKSFTTVVKLGTFVRAHKASISIRRKKFGTDIESFKKSFDDESETTSSILSLLSRIRSLGTNVFIEYKKSEASYLFDVVISTNLGSTLKDRNILLSKEEDKKLMTYARKVGNMFMKKHNVSLVKAIKPLHSPSVRKYGSSYVISHISYFQNAPFVITEKSHLGQRQYNHAAKPEMLNLYQKSIMELNKEKLESNELYTVEYDEASMTIIVKVKDK